MILQRSSSENVSWNAGIGVRPSLIFQNSAPSVCCHSLGSDKLPGRTETPFRSRVAAAGPSPFPRGPWQGRQPTTKSSFPLAMVFASAGMGFCLRAARAGAVQNSATAFAASSAKAMRKFNPANASTTRIVRVSEVSCFSRTGGSMVRFITDDVALAFSRLLHFSWLFLCIFCSAQLKKNRASSLFV